MNERIKELAEQATRKYDRLGFDIPFAQPDLQLFAELIVRECIDIVKKDSGVTLEDKIGLIFSIKEQFGVKL